jgi:ABC-type amino acid transport substrate-binding protein
LLDIFSIKWYIVHVKKTEEDKTMKKFIAIVMSLVLIASVAMLAGCGKKDDVKAAKVIGIDLTNENYAFGVDKAQPELLEKTNAFIDKILSNGTFDEICSRYSSGGEPVLVKSAAKDSSKDQLVVATNAAFEPFEYTVGDSYAGIDMEIAKLLADELGKELVIDNMDFDAVCLSVGQHKCDIAMAGLTVNPDREASVTFSKTYYKASQRVVVKGDDTTFDDCKTADDVLKKLQSFDASVKIGYQNGTTGGMYINNESDYASNNLKVTGKGYKNGSLAIQDLINGNINYVIIDSAPADSIVKSINEVA